MQEPTCPACKVEKVEWCVGKVLRGKMIREEAYVDEHDYLCTSCAVELIRGTLKAI